MSAPDRFLPEHEFSEHHRRTVAASPAMVDRALRAVRPADVRLTRALMRMRSGRRGLLSRAGPDTRFLEQLSRDLKAVVLSDDPGRELALGIVGQPWRLRGGQSIRLESAGAFAAFAAPGFMKAVLSFSFVPHPRGTSLETETRVHVTDPASRRRFAPYWFAIRLGSGAIRRDLLRAAARRAEDRSGG
jgi:hypothetical protein